MRAEWCPVPGCHQQSFRTNPIVDARLDLMHFEVQIGDAFDQRGEHAASVRCLEGDDDAVVGLAIEKLNVRLIGARGHAGFF